MEEVHAFINSLIDAKGYTTLDAEVREQLVEDMTGRLMDQINRAAIDALSDEQADELSRRLDDENFSEEQMMEFMQNSGVDLKRVTMETMLEFRAFYLGGGAGTGGAEGGTAGTGGAGAGGENAGGGAENA